MHTRQHHTVMTYRLWGLLLVLSVGGCSAAYHFRYHYTQVTPPGGTAGIEDDQVRIQLRPVPAGGAMQLTITNKHTQPLAIVWEQSYYLDPVGRRRPATESGLHWFRPSQWFSADTLIAPGDSLRLQVHAGERQYYNPLAVVRDASGQVSVSGTPPPFLPTAGRTRAAGTGYEGQEFHFILALRLGTEVIPYPFTFRITAVEVR